MLNVKNKWQKKNEYYVNILLFNFFFEKFYDIIYILNIKKFFILKNM